MLVQHGAKLMTAAYSGNTAFLIACSGYGKYTSVKWLVEHGANIYAKAGIRNSVDAGRSVQ